MAQNLSLQHRRPWFNPCLRKTSWRRKWHPTPVSFPGEFHGQKSLAGYRPREYLYFIHFCSEVCFSSLTTVGLVCSFFFFFSVSQGVKLGYICGLSFFLMLGIYHHILLSQNGFCCIPYVLVCCVSIFVSLRYFYDWKGYDFSLLALAKACFVSQSVIRLRERSVLTGEECVSCRCWAQCSVYIRSPFGLRYSPLCSYWLSA